MTIPPMCEELTFDEITAALVSKYQEYVPDYIRNESDEIMPLLETVSYREQLLRSYVNNLVRQSFWQTATGADLDFHAGEFFIERDKGSKPTATVVFTLNTLLGSNYTLEAGLEMINADGSTSVLLGDVVISSGMSEADGIVELQLYVSSSDTTVVSTMVPKPYIASATQTSTFSGGSDPMDDDALRALIALADEQFTTAGSAQSYKYWARQSDTRIDDVNAYRSAPGVIDVIVHSIDGVDSAMLTRVSNATSSEIHRPLNDTVNVRAATIIEYTVSAVITVSADADATSTLSTAKARLMDRLNAITIGKSVTIGMIISALSVEGVEDVTITSPTATVGAGEDEVAIASLVEVSVG